MGSLSNLYISQSYQSLIHIATNNTASATLIDLQDGLGNSIGVSVNTAGDLYLSGSLTASLQQGYLYVGGVNGKTYAFPTASLVTNIDTGSLVNTASFNAYTSSNNQRVSSLESNSASVNISVNALNVFTASQSTASLVTSINELNTFSASAKISINALNSATSSYITESETASFARTNVDNNFTANQTFTNITAVSASFTYVQTLYETASVIYSSGSNQLGDELTDIQTLSGSVKVQGSLTVNGTPVLTSSVDISGLVTTASFNAYTQSNDQRVSSLEINSASVNTSISNINTTTASLLVETQNLELFSASTLTRLTNIETTTASLLIETQNLELFSASQLLLNGTFATTGSNTFIGNQTLQDPGGNFTTLTPVSGGLMLVAKLFNSSSAHISASAFNYVNLIFKNNNNTADLVISGSNNIFPNPSAAAAGFKKYVGGSNNIINTLSGISISGSMGFSPSINSNFIPGAVSFRGPVSPPVVLGGYTMLANAVLGTINVGSSAVLNAEKLPALSLQTNTINGTLNIIANQTQHAQGSGLTNNLIVGTVTLNLSSSAVVFNNNVINDAAFVLTNQYSSTAIGSGSVQFLRNNIAGNGQQVIASGSLIPGTTSVATVADNFVGGGGNIIYCDISNATVIGTNAYHMALRNMLFGQQLIISGSSTTSDTNSYGSAFMGRWNANDSIRNKTANTIFAVGTGTSTARKTGFLIDSGSNTYVEGTLNVSGSTSTTGSITIKSGSGDLFVHGNKQFNVGAFYSTITQSGSAAVSQSMTFNTTDISQGITMVGGTQFTFANSGVYNIQFSAQILADTGADDVWIWLKKNGTNIPDTAGRVTLANNDELMAAWNYVVNVNANDYIELVWQNSNGDAVLLYNAPTGNIPAVTSVIATVTQVR